MTAQFRQYFYLFSTLASALVPILVAFGLVTTDQGDSWLKLITLLGGLLGTGAAGTAAVILGKQRKDGTLDPAPSPADQVINCLPQVIQNVNHANGELDRVKQAIEVLGHRPLGPLATQIINRHNR